MHLLSSRLRCGFVVGALCALSPALHAQDAKGRTVEDRAKLPLNVAPIPTEIAPIDPAARDLVARTMNRYRTLKSFEGLITRTSKYDGTEGKPSSRTQFVRIQLDNKGPYDRGRFVLGTWSPSERLSADVLSVSSWDKDIYDGKDLINFGSTSGNRYHIDAFRFPLGMPRERRIEAAMNTEGPLFWFLTGSQHFTAHFLSPFLTRLAMAPDGALQKVSMEFSYKLDTDAFGEVGVSQTPSQIELWIDPKTLTLDHARVVNSTTIGEFTDIETYSQTRFNPKFDPKIFRVAAPKGYIRESSGLDSYAEQHAVR